MTKKRIICFLIMLCVCTCFLPANMIWANELNASIAFSSASVSQNDQVTVTLTFTNTTPNISKVDCSLTYNENVVELVSQSGGGGNYFIQETVVEPTDTITITLTFTAIGTGSSDFSIENCNFWDAESNLLGTATAQKKLLVSSPMASSNANLASLSISYGTLEPEFSPEITEYTVLVDNSVTKFPVTALPEDKEASATITGSQNLAVGENRRVITVTSPDGTKTKNYTITIVRAAPEPTITPIVTATPTPTKRPSPTPNQTQIQWGTPAHDITDEPKDSATPQIVETPAPTTAKPSSTPSGATVEDLKNTMVIAVVIIAIIVIVILFTVVYIMQQSDKKKSGKGKRK